MILLLLKYKGKEFRKISLQARSPPPISEAKQLKKKQKPENHVFQIKKVIFVGASRPVAVPNIGREESPGNIERHTS